MTSEHRFQYLGVVVGTGTQQGAECSCSNPDGEGVGGVYWYEHSIEELVERYIEHLQEVEADDRQKWGERAKRAEAVIAAAKTRASRDNNVAMYRILATYQNGEDHDV